MLMQAPHKFAVEDIVTLKAMLHPTAAQSGEAQRLAVVSVRADWGEHGIPIVRYYCRVLCDGGWNRKNQTFYTTERLVNGLTLLDEVELATCPEPEPEPVKEPA